MTLTGLRFFKSFFHVGELFRLFLAEKIKPADGIFFVGLKLFLAGGKSLFRFFGFFRQLTLRALEENDVAAFGFGFLEPVFKLFLLSPKLGDFSAALIFIKQVNACVIQLF